MDLAKKYDTRDVAKKDLYLDKAEGIDLSACQTLKEDKAILKEYEARRG